MSLQAKCDSGEGRWFLSQKTNVLYCLLQSIKKNCEIKYTIQAKILNFIFMFMGICQMSNKLATIKYLGLFWLLNKCYWLFLPEDFFQTVHFCFNLRFSFSLQVVSDPAYPLSTATEWFGCRPIEHHPTEKAYRNHLFSWSKREYVRISLWIRRIVMSASVDFFLFLVIACTLHFDRIQFRRY